MVSAIEQALRDPDLTRFRILEAAMDEVHNVGFQAASLNRILEKTQLTKGALYHHFRSKEELGKALVGELIREHVLERWVRPLEKSDDPIGTFLELLRTARQNMSSEELRMGCPLNNLAQEMSSHHEGFRKVIQTIYQEWIQGLASALSRGQEQGTVNKNKDPRKVATFIVAAMEGCIGLTKNAQSTAILEDAGEALMEYLESLRL